MIASSVSEPEARERGSSLIGKKLHYRRIQSLFLTKRKELWLPNARSCGYARLNDLGCAMNSQGIVQWLSANGRFRMRSRLARNGFYAGMGDLESAVDYHVLSSYTDFQLRFCNLV